MNSVEIDRELPVIVPGAVCFETGASRGQLADPTLCVYEHHGEEFGWADTGALTCLFDDLLHGRDMPPKFVSSAVHDVDTLVAIALHRRPAVVLHPNTLKLVTSAELVHRRGAIGLAHADAELVRFFQLLRGLLPKRLSKKLIDECLETTVEFILDYVENDRLPHLGREPEPPVVLVEGQRGFVVAETGGPLGEAWVQLYRKGYLRGVVVGMDVGGRRQVLAARRGPFVAFQLETAARLLNEMERAMGEPPGWNSDGIWLAGPSEGTLILVSHLLEVLVRV